MTSFIRHHASAQEHHRWYDRLRLSDARSMRVVLGRILMIAAGIAIVAVALAQGSRTTNPPGIRQCAAMARPAKRLACYDALAARRASSWPAKGAMAPAVQGSSKF